MVDQLRQFAQEVTRLAKAVGTDGVLGGQAVVPDVQGTWADLTQNVNFMASNLTTQVREIASVTTAVAKGDLSRKIKAEVRGEILDLKNTINEMVDRLNTFAFQVSKVAREVGTDGVLGGQAEVNNVEGKWAELTDNVNIMAQNLTQQVRGISDVTQAIARGDLSRKIEVHAQGEVLRLKVTSRYTALLRSYFWLTNGSKRYGYPTRYICQGTQASRERRGGGRQDGWSSQY